MMKYFAEHMFQTHVLFVEEKKRPPLMMVDPRFYDVATTDSLIVVAAEKKGVEHGVVRRTLRNVISNQKRRLLKG
jgi:hypothetical protein